MTTYEYDVILEGGDEVAIGYTDAALARRYAMRRAEQLANTGVPVPVLIRVRAVEDV